MGSAEFDLAQYEARNDRLETEQAALEARAEPEFIFRMKNLDSDVISEALEYLSAEELRSIAEDLAMTDMRDVSHAGLMLSDCVQRFVMRQAMSEIQED